MDNANTEDAELIPRNYQNEMFAIACERNTILFLPTGAGKTFVSIMVMKHYKEKVEAPYINGGQRIFFIAPKVALVEQQAEVIRRHTGLNTAAYVGNMGVDNWSANQWQDQFICFQVLVMSAQILLDCLNHSYITMDRICLLVMDECHHATEEHPMHVIIKEHYNANIPEKMPRLLGLTATLIKRNVKPDRVKQEVMALESNMKSAVVHLSCMEGIEGLYANPDIKIESCKNVKLQKSAEIVLEILAELEDDLNLLQQVDRKCHAPLKIPFFIEGFLITSGSSMYKELTRMVKDIRVHIKHLGIYGGDIAVLAHLVSLQRMLCSCQDDDLLNHFKMCITTLLSVRRRVYGLRNMHSAEIMSALGLSDLVVRRQRNYLIFLHKIFHGQVQTDALTSQLHRIPGKVTRQNNLFHVAHCRTDVEQRKIFYDEMKHYSTMNQIEKYSSPKVLRLIEIICQHLQELKKRKLDEDDNAQESALCGLVFVERRITAKVIYHILQIYKKHNEKLKLLKPDFAVGVNKNSFDTREYLLDAKKNSKSLQMFNTGETNLIIASNVLEEGIDIPKCNMVIKFDAPVTFCSFIQSKGRARDQSATFYVLDLDDAETPSFAGMKNKFLNIEQQLQRYQLDEDDENMELELELQDEYTTKIGAKATVNNAVKIIYSYCQSLPQDYFSDVHPLWFAKEKGGTCEGITTVDGIQCTVLLPLTAKYPKPIVGELMKTRKAARNSVALKAVKLLHQLGALDDHLKPTKDESKDFQDSALLFPHWVEDDENKSKTGPKAGSKKNRQSYDKHTPSMLVQCAPSADSLVYMHLIQMTPVYERPGDDDNRRQTFYNLLSDQTESIAVITSKCWPNLCEYPIFMNVGEIKITIQVNFKTLNLTEAQILKLRKIHLMLMTQLLSLGKEFLIADFQNGKSNYLVVPTIVGSEGAEINWPLVEQCPDVRQRGTRLTGKEENLHLQVVTPWYRGYNTKFVASENKNYVITKVRHDMNPNSPFPSNAHTTYKEYYRSKYTINISSNDQPLLDVKAITNKINFLNPRGVIPGMNRRRRQDMNDDFEEVLVPELCELASASVLVTAQLWIKVTALPTILFRASRLLIAEEMRLQICRETGLGAIALPAGSVWEPMTIDSFKALGEVPCKDIIIPKGYGPPKIKCLAPNINQMTTPWEESEPVDLDHNLTSITMLEIREYDDFATKKLNPRNDNIYTNDNIYHKRDTSILVKPIAMLSPRQAKMGPQQHKMYAALTTTLANDSIDMERLESLGDSFLKYAVSLYLFCTYEHSEGRLTQLKGKIVGNRNLYYCGKNKKIGNILSAQSFYVNSDWKVPNLEVDSKLKDLITQLEICPSILHEIKFTEEERETGKITEASWQKVQDIFMDTASEVLDLRDSNSNEVFLDKQTVPDKCVADCVEALLGAYIESCGPLASAKLLSWFGILPASIGEVMTSQPACSIRNDDPTINVEAQLARHLTGTDTLERQLGYRFKDRGLLLQALSHPSYISNRLTDCFQRLEFLGDAVLDFLVTCHIYEQCGNLNPGQLTDLRSALVNNITFASLTVRYGFHCHMLHQSARVISSVDNFVRYQEQNNHCISEEYLLLLQEDSAQVATTIDVPKVLGDLFESLAGAVFLDSGKNLTRTWEVFYPLMKKEIDLFSAKVPKQPVRMLYESCTDNNLRFEKPHKLASGQHVMIKLSLELQGKQMSFFGLGENKSLAKRAAAKCALKYMSQQP